MRIARLSIENVRAIERLEIDLTAVGDEPRRRLILLGGNGTGKTTILAAIAHMIGRERTELAAQRLGAGDICQVGRPLTEATAELPKGTITMEMFLSQAERERFAKRSGRRAPNSIKLHAELGNRSEIDEDLLQNAIAAWTENASQAADLIARVESWPLEVITSRRTPPVVLLPADRGALNDTGQVLVSKLNEFNPFSGCLADSRERFQLIPSLLAMAHTAPALNDRDGIVARMWKVFEKYFPEMPRLVGVRGLQLVFETSAGAVVDLAKLSDGQRAILLILGELALRNPSDGIVLIDEIEQHLHPRWQQAMLDALVSLLPDAQFIITTQAPYVAACAPDDLLKLGDWGRDGAQ